MNNYKKTSAPAFILRMKFFYTESKLVLFQVASMENSTIEDIAYSIGESEEFTLNILQRLVKDGYVLVDGNSYSVNWEEIDRYSTEEDKAFRSPTIEDNTSIDTDVPFQGEDSTDSLKTTSNDEFELWFPIEGFKDYEISTLGRVVSYKRSKPKIMKTRSYKGQQYVGLYDGEKQQQYKISSLLKKNVQFLKAQSP